LGRYKTRLAGGALGNLASPGSAMLEMLAETAIDILPALRGGLIRVISIT